MTRGKICAKMFFRILVKNVDEDSSPSGERQSELQIVRMQRKQQTEENHFRVAELKEFFSKFCRISPVKENTYDSMM